MPAFVDITGKTFGRLTVLEKLIKRTAHGLIKWLCICNCPAHSTIEATAYDLKSGHVRSCGCLRKENTSARFKKHGLEGSPEYEIWLGIKKRCYNVNSNSYARYGGRGITVSSEWKESFETFYRDMGQRPSSKHSIDRIDNDKGYFKENCRWASHTEQANNTRANVFYEINGETRTIAELASKYSTPYATMRIRLLNYMKEETKNWQNKDIPSTVSDNKALITLEEYCKKYLLKFETIKKYLSKGMLFEVAIKFDSLILANGLFSFDSKIKPINKFIKRRGLGYPLFYQRLFLGWTIKEALTMIDKREIIFSTTGNPKDNQIQTLKWWCDLLSIDNENEIYLRVLRGEDFAEIIKNT